MATKTGKQPEETVIAVPLSWAGMEDSPVHTVTNVLSQVHEDMFIVTFGFNNPPVLMGTAAQVKKQAESIKSVHVSTVSRVAMTEPQLAKTIQTLQTTLKRYRNGKKKEEEKLS